PGAREPAARASGSGGDSRTGVVLTTARATGFAGRRRPGGWSGSDGHAGRCPPGGRHVAANSPSRSWPRSRQISLNWASEVFSEHLAQHRDIHHRLRQEPLQLRILVLELLQPLRLADLHAAILRAPVVEGRIADPVLPAQLCGAQPRLMLLQDADNLLFREPAAFHVRLLLWRTD